MTILLLRFCAISASLEVHEWPAWCRPAQFAEETRKADRVVPWGIIWSVVAQAFLGMSYLIVLLFCIQVGLHASTDAFLCI